MSILLLVAAFVGQTPPPPEPMGMEVSQYQTAVTVWNSAIDKWKADKKSTDKRFNVATMTLARLEKRYKVREPNLTETQKTNYAKHHDDAALALIDAFFGEGKSRRAMAAASRTLENARVSLTIAESNAWVAKHNVHLKEMQDEMYAVVIRMDAAETHLLAMKAILD